LLFELRGVDESELVAGADQGAARLNSAPAKAKVLGDGDVAALFGLDMAENAGSNDAAVAAAKSRRSPRIVGAAKRSAHAQTPALQKGKPTRQSKRKRGGQTRRGVADSKKSVRPPIRGKAPPRA
jgi:hypothetical protein